MAAPQGPRAPQPRPSSHSQHKPSSERPGSALNPANQASSIDTQSRDPNAPSEGHSSHRLGSSSTNPEQTLRTKIGHATSRQAYQRAAAAHARDDPFLSDELFTGMRNGRPENDHVGSMYTLAQQQEIDEYYRRLLLPRQRSTAPETTMPPPSPPPRLWMYEARPRDGADLAVGDITRWNAEWAAFVNDCNARPLLRAHFPDEYPPGPRHGRS